MLHLIYQKEKWGRAAAWIIVGVLYLLQPQLPSEFMLQMTALDLLYFMAGYEVRQRFAKDETFSEKLAGIPAMAVGFVIMVSMLALMENGLKQVAVESFGALGGIVFFYGLACRIKGVLGTWLDEVSTYSLQIFLLGGYALVFTRTLMVMVLGVQLPIVIILFNFIGDLLITWLISRFILARFKVFRFFSGL